MDKQKTQSDRVTITDPHVITLLATESERRGHSTLARTATNLLLERLTLLAHERGELERAERD